MRGFSTHMTGSTVPVVRHGTTPRLPRRQWISASTLQPAADCIVLSTRALLYSAVRWLLVHIFLQDVEIASVLHPPLRCQQSIWFCESLLVLWKEFPKPPWPISSFAKRWILSKNCRDRHRLLDLPTVNQIHTRRKAITRLLINA